MKFETAVLRSIRAEGLVAPGDRVLAAVSGGPDSVALLHALAAVARRLRCEVAVAHLDHGLRGEEGAGDAEFVAGLARELGLSARVGREPVERRRGESVEMAARRTRYTFLAASARELTCNRVATGHTADDQAETVLLMLFRGAGIHALGGMRPSRPLDERDPAGPALIRPLLGLPRADVLAYLTERGAAYRTDSTNASPDPVRNRLRHEILPLITGRISPAAPRTLAKLASRCSALDSYIRAQAASGDARAAAFLAAAGGKAGRGAREDRPHGPPFPDSPLAVPGEAFVPSPEFLGRGCAVRITARTVDAPVRVPHDVAPLPIGGPGAPFAVEFDWEGIEPPLTVRARRPGDRISPRGMTGSKSLQDLFVDRKVPRTERKLVPVVADRSRVLWVVAQAVSREAPVTDGTRSRLVLACETLDSPEWDR